MSNSRINMPAPALSGGDALAQTDKSAQAKNIPVEIVSTPQGDKLKFNHRELAITYLDAKDQQNLKQDAIRLTVLTQLSAAANSTSMMNASVQAQGLPTSLPLPKGLVAYINANQISLEQLTNFASRPQGYPLGEVKITANQLFFNDSQLVRLSSPSIADGQYLAKIAIEYGRLTLTLTPKLAEVNLLLTPTGKDALMSNANSPAHYLSPSSSQALISKPELASAYHQLINTLAKTPLRPESLNGIIRELSTPHRPVDSSSILMPGKASANATLPKDLMVQIPLRSAQSPDKTPDKTAAIFGSQIGKALVSTPTSDNALLASESKNPQGALLKEITQIAQSRLYQNVSAMLSNIRLSNIRLADIRLTDNSLTGIRLEATPLEQRMAKTTAQLQQLSPAALAKLTALEKQAGQISATGTSPAARDIGQTQSSPRGLPPNGLQSSDVGHREVGHRGLNLALGQLADKALQAQKATAQGRNLLQLVQQLLPLAFPRALSELASPSSLRQELIDSLAGIAAPPAPVASLGSITSHAGTIGVLFQLLLGRQVKTQTSGKASSQLQGLQQLASGSQLLGLLEKSGGLESLGKLISNLSLYQQASSDSPQSTNWYFTLPYMIEHRHEELEGHFSQDEQEKNSSPHWRLQLKFNLSQAGLLINADVKDGRLNLGFSSEDQSLLDRIEQRLMGLEQKIQAIGITPNKIRTQVSQVPASLLPGEHYLVKIKA
ncbi:hypothetical protein [Shewanella sp. cp20]|uniref:hypothetical protein n=1 Tax=Shewanella sp. cp20 TaxID=1521167 RepID=UPI0005ADE141|nr:hypothetical protein [Shewanella sp. cp20]KIO36112.1 hypothetical protein DB48_13030 [Shewanella sp. cp20]